MLDVASRLLAGRLSGTAAGDLADSVKMAAACAALAVLLVDDVERALGPRPFDVSGLGPVEVERAAKRTSAAI